MMKKETCRLKKFEFISLSCESRVQSSNENINRWAGLLLLELQEIDANACIGFLCRVSQTATNLLVIFNTNTGKLGMLFLLLWRMLWEGNSGKQ